jgi:hypothetical protein
MPHQRPALSVRTSVLPEGLLTLEARAANVRGERLCPCQYQRQTNRERQRMRIDELLKLIELKSRYSVLSIQSSEDSMPVLGQYAIAGVERMRGDRT